jgi:hypothetical protein
MQLLYQCLDKNPANYSPGASLASLDPLCDALCKHNELVAELFVKHVQIMAIFFIWNKLNHG